MFSVLFVIIPVILVIELAMIIKRIKKEADIKSLKKLDIAGYICNIILSILYIPVSFFSWLLFMASEATIGATNQIFIILVNVFCYVTISIPFLCISGIVLSVIFRIKGYSILSFVVQFLPIVIFGLNLLLLFIAESLPSMV